MVLQKCTASPRHECSLVSVWRMDGRMRKERKMERTHPNGQFPVIDERLLSRCSPGHNPRTSFDSQIRRGRSSGDPASEGLRWARPEPRLGHHWVPPAFHLWNKSTGLCYIILLTYEGVVVGLQGVFCPQDWQEVGQELYVKKYTRRLYWLSE